TTEKSNELNTLLNRDAFLLKNWLTESAQHLEHIFLVCQRNKDEAKYWETHIRPIYAAIKYTRIYVKAILNRNAFNAEHWALIEQDHPTEEQLYLVYKFAVHNHEEASDEVRRLLISVFPERGRTGTN
ncbi:hypothetical protein ACQE9F_29015, partial [Klebsiella pneumoniae]